MKRNRIRSNGLPEKPRETLALRTQLATASRALGHSTVLFSLAGANHRATNGNGARSATRIEPSANGGSTNEGARRSFQIVILGLSITSSWGNGHATTYRGLVRELVARGHQVLFLERDLEWYASNRDMPNPPYGSLALYNSTRELKDRFTRQIRNADVVIVGSYVPEGAVIGDWVTRIAKGATAFYDIDTPVTMASLTKGDLAGPSGAEYLSTSLIAKYDLYLSFTGGPILDLIENRYGSPMARPLYCSVDPALYFPEEKKLRWDLGYMGTYSDDRQPALDELLLEPARHWSQGKFVVAGPQYPQTIRWPRNVKRYMHLAPSKHRAFYNSQRFTLNITRANMVEAGYSPSVRLFEAAACGTPIISDYWEGLEVFFEPNEEILLAHSSEEALSYLISIGEKERRRIGTRARTRVLARHTAKHRALELESYICDVLKVDSAPETVAQTTGSASAKKRTRTTPAVAVGNNRSTSGALVED